MITVALIILGLPLLAFVLNVFVTRRNKTLSAVLAILAMAVAMVLALFVIFPAVQAGQTAQLQFNWLGLQPPGAPPSAGHPHLTLGIGVDSLASIMLIVVTVVSFLVHVYSRSYMIE